MESGAPPGRGKWVQEAPGQVTGQVTLEEESMVTFSASQRSSRVPTPALGTAFPELPDTPRGTASLEWETSLWGRMGTELRSEA